ncbi:MAG: PhzF family phenazine biosynthesis protein [Bacteroidetes bacterium]|nr:PhzF family phenazine biosynthesis protein [Bacteroidota bacterium]
MDHKFYQVDVFTSKAFRGNPVAVIFDADHFSDEVMQQVANWINLSETTFIQSSSIADYKLRIFSPQKEFPFAGHPTIGSAYAVLKSRLINPKKKEILQECKAGLVRISIEKNNIFALVPKIEILSTKIDKLEFEDALGCKIISEPIAIISGPVWGVAGVDGCETLDGININTEKIIRISNKYNLTGLTIYSAIPGKGVFVRTFAPIVGVMEDPVCGGGNAAVARHLKHTGGNKTFGNKYTAYQGKSVKRDGIIQIKYDNEEILIGGEAKTIIKGMIKI